MRCGQLYFTAVMLIAAGSATASAQQLVPPPVAAEVSGAIDTVKLDPIFGQRFLCVEHALGELGYAGDALGTDCMVADGIEKDPLRSNQWTGMLKLYRTDGRANSDWYGWKADVLSPVDGTVIDVRANLQENLPGTMGSPPGSGISIRTGDGVIVTLGHIQLFTVATGAQVKAGQTIGKVGNNGQSRAPHVHIGAYREAGAVPLQIRWDLRRMADLRKAAGVP